MEYLQNASEQIRILFYSLGMGMLLGMVYDFVRFLRCLFSAKHFLLFLGDFIFVLLSAFATFSFVLIMNEGRVRLFIILGEILGFFIYYFSLGVGFKLLTDKLVIGVKSIFSHIAIFLSEILSRFKRLNMRACSFIALKHKKVLKNAKLLLKKKVP